MKRFYNMTEDERRCERVRRLPLVMKAFRDMSSQEIRSLVAAALCLSSKAETAKEVLP